MSLFTSLSLNLGDEAITDILSGALFLPKSDSRLDSTWIGLAQDFYPEASARNGLTFHQALRLFDSTTRFYARVTPLLDERVRALRNIPGFDPSLPIGESMTLEIEADQLTLCPRGGWIGSRLLGQVPPGVREQLIDQLSHCIALAHREKMECHPRIERQRN